MLTHFNIYPLQDSSVSIFGLVCALITYSLLCIFSDSRDYLITACVRSNKGTSLHFANWNQGEVALKGEIYHLKLLNRDGSAREKN